MYRQTACVDTVYNVNGYRQTRHKLHVQIKTQCYTLSTGGQVAQAQKLLMGYQTFSNLSFTGLGFMAVTLSVISLPTRNASSLDAPFSSTNKLWNRKVYNDIHRVIPVYSPISVPIYNPCPPLRCWVDQLDCTLQCFPPFLHNAVCNFHTRHSPREVRSCIPVSNIGDHLQPQLSSIQHLSKCLGETCYASIFSPHTGAHVIQNSLRKVEIWIHIWS